MAVLPLLVSTLFLIRFKHISGDAEAHLAFFCAVFSECVLSFNVLIYRGKYSKCSLIDLAHSSRPTKKIFFS